MANQSLKYSIVLVPFPFDDFSFSKVRPALCLTNSIGKYESIISIAFISSKINYDKLESDLLIKTDSHSSKEAGLRVDSVIKLHKLVTIKRGLIKRKLGTLNEDFLTEIHHKLEQLFFKQKLIPGIILNEDMFTFRSALLLLFLL